MGNPERLTDDEISSLSIELGTLTRLQFEALMHSPYPGRIATAGNIASPFTPLEIPLGQACEFNVYHLMKVDSPTALFPIRYEEV